MNLLKREFYVSFDMIPQSFEHVSAVVYRSQRCNKYYAVGFSGKRNKPDFNCYFSTEQNRERCIEQWVKNLESHLSEKQKRFEMRRNFSHSFKVGDILYAAWGYDQTNIDFYEVIKVNSNKFVVIRKVASKIIQTGFMSGTSSPQRGFYIGDELLKKVGLGNRIAVDKVSTAFPWDGQPCYCSWDG